MDAKKITKYIIAICALIATVMGGYEAFVKDIEEIKAEPEIKVEVAKLDSAVVDTTKTE